MIGNAQDVIAYLLDQPPEKLFEVKEKRKRRSLTANAYYWVLLNKLAHVMGMPDEELHRHMVMSWGVCEVVSVRVDVPVGDYFKYYQVYKTGAEFQHVRVYKGSSQMDSAEFSHLLKGLIEECEQQGIVTMTPAELAALPFEEKGK